MNEDTNFIAALPENPTHEGTYRRPSNDADTPVWLNYIMFEMAVRLGVAQRTGKRATDESIRQSIAERGTADELNKSANAAYRESGAGQAVLELPLVIDSFLADWDEKEYRLKSLDK